MLKCRAMDKIKISIHQTNLKFEQGCKLVEAYALVVKGRKRGRYFLNIRMTRMTEIRFWANVCCLN